MTGAEYLDLGEHDRHVVAIQVLADRVPTMVAGVHLREFDDFCTVAVDQSIARAIEKRRGGPSRETGRARPT